MTRKSALGFITLIVLLQLSSVKADGWLTSFSVTGFSAQWLAYNGAATNLLPQNNPSAANSPFWNSGADWGDYPNPYWVSFDLGSSVQVTQFEYKAYGDTTHDPEYFDLYWSADGSTWNLAQSFNGAAGSNLQAFTLTTPRQARYWKFSIEYTFSGYQAWVAYANFYITLGPPTQAAFGASGDDVGYYLSGAGNPYMSQSQTMWAITPISAGSNLYTITNNGQYLSPKVNGGGYNTDGAGQSYNQFTFTQQTDGKWYVFSPYLQSYNGYGYLCVYSTSSEPYSPWFCTGAYEWIL